jgi:hypothetical protein
MYSLFRAVPAGRLLLSEAPSLVGSLVIAELFYKFHSFTLEAIGFLVTWSVLSFVASRVLRFLGAPPANAARGP